MKSVLVFLSLSACATTITGSDRESTTRTGVGLELAMPHDASRVFPAPIDPALPGADRLAHQIRARFGDVVATELDLCVSPAGDVASAALPTSTGFSALDAALVRDASAWKFSPRQRPAAVASASRPRPASPAGERDPFGEHPEGFEAMPGPDGVKSCARARLVYRAPR